MSNDSRWTEYLTDPINCIAKKYRVRLEQPIEEAYIEVFKNGVYFEYEDITTKPVTLEIISDYEANVIMHEGRYHQIKRMFGKFQNKVIELHRYAIGPYALDKTLAPGESKGISLEHIKALYLT
jgi:16S rRNA pseudouridine516 synthase